MSDTKPSRPKFANPPVQKVGIAFIFDSDFQTNDFEKDVKNFTEKNQNSLQLVKTQFQLIPTPEQNISDTNTPIQALQKFASATFADQRHRSTVTITTKAFSFSQSRQSGYIPHYGLVLPEAKTYFESFLGDYQKISALELYYHDKVELPLIDNQVHTSDYFEINIKLPDNMDFIRSDIDLKLSLVIPEDQLPKSELILEIKHINSTDNIGMRFDFNWYLRSQVENKSEEVIVEQLNTMHKLMYSFFDSTFTDKCKELFNR